MTVQASAPLTCIETLCSATLSAQTGYALWPWSGQTDYCGPDIVPLHASYLSHLSPTWNIHCVLSDIAGLGLVYSDAMLHARHAPVEPVDRLLYELLEQL